MIRAPRITFLVLVIALLLALPAPLASTAPRRPGPNEVILHEKPNFDPQTGHVFRIKPEMRQRVVPLKGHRLWRNCRSIQVGRDVVAHLYNASRERPDVGVLEESHLGSGGPVKLAAAILVINRRRDGSMTSTGAIRGLPFCAVVKAGWDAGNIFTSSFQYHREYYFVEQAPGAVRVQDLGSVLQPEDQGADAITTRSGRYPSTHVKATLYPQRGARGAGALVFPRPSGRKYEDLWPLKFGDKARSIRVEWKGPESKAPGMPGVPVPSAPQTVFPDVSGSWATKAGARYELKQNGATFDWQRPKLKEFGQGRFIGPLKFELRITTPSGVFLEAGRVTQHTPIPSLRATRMTWSNKLELTRPPPKPPTQPPGTPPRIPDITGLWANNVGAQYHVTQTGQTFKWTVRGSKETALGRIVKGNRIEVRVRNPDRSPNAIPGTGVISRVDAAGKATRIDWGNKTWMTRKQSTVPSIHGTWISNLGLEYVISQTGDRFTWTQAAMKETATGRIVGKKLEVSVRNPLLGAKPVPGTGSIALVDATGKATRLNWNNKTWMTRK